MQPSLKIYLLGSFRLFVGGVAVSNASWQKRKAKLLIQILALQPTFEIHREELMEMLFPEMDEKTASANLYRMLYFARRALEPNRSSYCSSNFLLTEGKQIKLTTENGFWIDAKEFEQKAREALKTNNQTNLEAAVDLYKGDLLENEPFEEWAIPSRERLKKLFHLALQRLAENAQKQNNFEESHLWLDRILMHEPVDEAAHRAKMRLFYEQGNYSLALKQYEKCCEILQKELSVKPEQDTEELRRQILFNRLKKK